jgi:hypothetical protein
MLIGFVSVSFCNLLSSSLVRLTESKSRTRDIFDAARVYWVEGAELDREDEVVFRWG